MTGEMDTMPPTVTSRHTEAFATFRDVFKIGYMFEKPPENSALWRVGGGIVKSDNKSQELAAINMIF
jgi:hypothetical protein